MSELNVGDRASAVGTAGCCSRVVIPDGVVRDVSQIGEYGEISVSGHKLGQTTHADPTPIWFKVQDVHRWPECLQPKRDSKLDKLRAAARKAAEDLAEAEREAGR